MSITIIQLVEDQTLGIDMFGFMYRLKKNGTHKALSPVSGTRGEEMHWYIGNPKRHYTLNQNKCRFQDCMAKRGSVLA